MTSPAPIGEERTLEQRVEALISDLHGNAFAHIAAEIIALVEADLRESIARDIEAERIVGDDDPEPPTMAFNAAIGLAARIAGGVS